MSTKDVRLRYEHFTSIGSFFLEIWSNKTESQILAFFLQKPFINLNMHETTFEFFR